MKQWQKLLALLPALGFLLGSYKGYVALWEDEDPEPKHIFPCPVSALPEADREALEAGIHARSRIELEQILEDYLS